MKNKNMLKRKYHLYFLLLTAMVIFVACGHSEDDSVVEPTETVTLLIAAPQSSGTRAIGDPGEAVQEGEDWDELAVIIAYTALENEPSVTNLPIIVKTLTKQDFERLPIYSSTTYRQLRLDVWRGKVHIYGVTYSSTAANGPKADIQACSTEEAVKNLTISNDYATGAERSTEKFLSVATGYYQQDNGSLAEYDISSKNPIYGELAPNIPSMRLTRLATKIDIQWDAQDAYTQGYTDVKVDEFKYVGGATDGDKGRLFPDLCPTNGEVLNGSKTFFNQTPISKRNGRVYHYVFPDGASKPTVTFSLSGNDNRGKEEKEYTFQFENKIQKSAWYKVNTTIRGMTGNTTIIKNN